MTLDACYALAKALGDHNREREGCGCKFNEAHARALARFCADNCREFSLMNDLDMWFDIYYGH